MKKALEKIFSDLEEISSSELMERLHEAKRNKQKQASEEIEKEFIRRDRIKISQSLRGNT